MLAEIYDNHSSLIKPVALPCFVGDEQRSDVWADGYQVHQMTYDGFRNKIEITPLIRNPWTMGMIPVGQSYTMTCKELVRRLCNPAKY